MKTQSAFNMDKHSDLIDVVVCTLFGLASVAGAAWLVLTMESFWPLSFLG